MNTVSKNNKIFIIGGAIVIFIIVFFIMKGTGSKSLPFHGKWKCGNGYIIEIKKNKTLKIYDENDKTLYSVSGNYTLDKTDTEYGQTRYVITFNEKELTTQGKTTKSENKQPYKILMMPDNKDEITFTNTNSWSTHYCDRIK